VRDLEPWLDRPHAWFGHSMGALVAYETCQAMRRAGTAAGFTAPVRLLVSGRPAPHLAERDPPVHGAPDPAFVARLWEMNGTPREILEDNATLSAILPVLRADFSVTETYRWRPRDPLDYPVSVFGGSDDPYATMGELLAWRQHSAAGCDVRIFPGDHFYLRRCEEQLLLTVATHLAPRPGTPAVARQDRDDKRATMTGGPR
jgi:medium-chain acyl-[acyl-carrier-protein] hydrolase